MLSRCRCLVLIALVSSILNAQSRMELLQRTAKFYSNLDSFDVKGNATERLPGTSWQASYDFETEGAQPKFIPVGLRGSSMKVISWVGNFRKSRIDPEGKDAFPWPGPGMPPIGRYSDLTGGLLDAQRIGAEMITFEGHTYSCEVIDAIYDESPEFKPHSKSSHRRIYIDPETLRVLKEIVPDPRAGEWTAVLTSITLNQPPSHRMIEALQRFPTQPKDRPEWVGRNAPKITLADLSGNRVSLADLRGKPVFLDFWGTYCPPCKRATSFAQHLAERYPTGLTVLSITQDTPDDARSWLTFNHLSLPALLDPDGAAFKGFEVNGIPVAILLDDQGKVVKYWTGVDDQKDVESTVEAVVRRPLSGSLRNQ